LIYVHKAIWLHRKAAAFGGIPLAVQTARIGAEFFCAVVIIQSDIAGSGLVQFLQGQVFKLG
jgi:hypothetical protein